MSSPSSSSSTSSLLASLGLGYSIAIAFGFLVLLSSVILVSYICFCRRRRRRRLRLLRGPSSPSPDTHSPSDGIILPRIIFFAEDDADLESEGNAAVGLAQAVINSYPKFAFAKETARPGSTTCSICLCEYRDSEVLRMMPECRHFFHLICLDSWLKLNGSCPVCRNSPLPTPLSTPLSEVVPLSQYGEDRRRRP